MTHHILGRPQPGCVCLCLCTSGLPSRIRGNVGFYILCVPDLSGVCFLSDHPNRVVGEDTQVVPGMNSKALSVSRAGRAELHTPKQTHTLMHGRELRAWGWARIKNGGIWGVGREQSDLKWRCVETSGGSLGENNTLIAVNGEKVRPLINPD